MARYVLKSPYVAIGASGSEVNISNHITQVMVHSEDTAVTETVTAGNAWAENTLSGKGRWSVTLTFATDAYSGTAPAGLDQIIRGLLPVSAGGTSTDDSQHIVMRPDAAARGPANPERSGDIVLHAWDPQGSGQVGGVVTQSQTWVGTGALSYNNA